MSKLKIGDTVKIINYGHPISITKKAWSDWFAKGYCDTEIPKNLLQEDETFYTYDMSPEVVGQIGKVQVISNISGYCLSGIKGKFAWYNEEQLEKYNNL